MKTNPKLVWKYVKRRTKVCGGIPDINDGTKYLSGSTSKAECFYQYFQSVFLVFSVVETTMCNTVALLEMADIEISEQGVASLLKDLIANSASGPDQVSDIILKNCALSISPFLTAVFRKSLLQGALTDDWKWANVIPIYKSGDKSSTCNYRPISLKCVSCKTLGHIIYSNLVKYLQTNNFFCPTQHGFQKGFSCDTQLIEFMHDFAITLNSGSQIDCIFLDFSKAFDTVTHSLLLLKLSCLNTSADTLAWLQAYLSFRKQCTIIIACHRHMSFQE